MNLIEIPNYHREVIINLMKSGATVASELTDAADADLWHAATGIATEAGEILRAVLGAHLQRCTRMSRIGSHRDEQRNHRHESPWEGVTDASDIDVNNILEEMSDHLFYEGALRIAANLETLYRPEIFAVSDYVWRASVSPLSFSMEEGESRKTVLIDLAMSHAVVSSAILDVAKRRVIYRKGMDEILKDGTTLRGRLAQHLFDDAWIMSEMASIIGVSEDHIRAFNIDKLCTGENARYKNGYSDDAANARSDKDGHLDGLGEAATSVAQSIREASVDAKSERSETTSEDAQ